MLLPSLLALALPLGAYEHPHIPGGLTGAGWKVTPPFHRDAELFPIVDEGRWGFIDTKGNVVVEPAFEDVRPFVNGAAAVQSEGRWGVVGANGDFFVAPAFSDAGVISDGMLAVRQPRGDLWSFLSTKQLAAAVKAGGKAPPLSYFLNPVGDFHDGFAVVTVKQKPSGERISQVALITKSLAPWSLGSVEPLTDFSEGLAGVRLYDEGVRRPGTVLIDTAGATVGQLADVTNMKNYAEGLAPATNSGAWGYIDRRGRWAVPPKFTVAEPFSEGRAAVMNGQFWGFIDTKGTEVVPVRYRHVEPFSGGLAAVCEGVGAEQTCGYVDASGKTVIAPRYWPAYAFVRGVALVRTRQGIYKYIGKDGKDIYSPAFTAADIHQGQR